MPTRHVTIRDVAREAGVSVATVSYVLNNSRRVRPETRAKVMQAVTKLGYRPSIAARNLQSQLSRMIGYNWQPAPPDRFHPILDRFVHSMGEAAAMSGYHLLTFTVPSGANEVSVYRELIRTRWVDGFVLTNTNFNDPRITYLLQTDIPFVAFGRSNPEWDFPYVDVDGRAGVRTAVDHLVQLGHRRIAMLAWPEGSVAGDQRYQGYVEGMREAGLFDPTLVKRGEHRELFGRRAVQEWLTLPPAQRPTAVICVSDLVAVGVINGALDAGLRIPDDLAVVGFDDVPMVQYLRPPLTSIRQPVDEAGQRVVEMLLTLIREEDLPPEQRHVLLTPQLIVRASTVGEQAATRADRPAPRPPTDDGGCQSGGGHPLEESAC